MEASTDNRYDLSTLLNKRIPIDQAALPITPLGAAADRAENMRKHKVYSTARAKDWNPYAIKKHPERSTGDVERAKEARRSNEETTV